MFLPLYTISVRLSGPSLHAVVPPAAPPVPPASPAHPYGELAHTLKWLHPGKFTSDRIQFDGFRVARDGHDTGTGIGHVSAPVNAGIALAILLSKYKLNFGASAVKVQGDPIAIFFWVVMPPVYCAQPVSLPALTVPNSLATWSTVKIGASYMDMAAGWGSIGLDMAADLVTMIITKGYEPPGPFSLKDFVKGIAVDFVKGLAVDVGKAVARYATTGSWGSIRGDILFNTGIQINENPDTHLPESVTFGTQGEPAKYGTLFGSTTPAPAPPPPAAPRQLPQGVPHVE